MNRAGIQAKVALGLSKGAQFAGGMVSYFRQPYPGGPALRTPLVYFDPAPNLESGSAQLAGHPYVYAVMDTTDVRVGDVMITLPDLLVPNLALDTYFIVRWEPMKAPLCVLATAVLTLSTIDRAATDAATGFQSPSGPGDVAPVVLATGLPASMLAKARGDQPAAHLPTDTRQAYFEALTPAVPGIAIVPGMTVSTADGQSYAVATSERTPYGYRLLVLANST